MKVEFVTVDVFSSRRFGGNPVAVVTDARGLRAERMQQIAAEFNLSETTFVLPPDNPGHTARVRIFTPRAELPFAGHPNVGTAFALALRGWVWDRAIGRELRFEEQAGIVELEIARDGDVVLGARLKSPQNVDVSRTVPVSAIAAACALEPDDVETATHQPIVASCGLPFVMAEVRSRNALRAARPRMDVFAERIPVELANGIHLYAQSSENDAEIHCRMFAPLHGIQEDPATGSANVALIGLLARLDDRWNLTLSRKIVQGVDMGRPSLLKAVAEKKDGKVIRTWIGGPCVTVMQGTLELA